MENKYTCCETKAVESTANQGCCETAAVENDCCVANVEANRAEKEACCEAAVGEEACCEPGCCEGESLPCCA